MGQHFKLTNQEFDDNTDLFNTLEIKAEQVIGKDHQKLSTILKKQYRKLISVSHPDKGGDKNRFDQIYKAYQALEKCIIPLKSGDPCVKISVDAESDGRLTAREFHYRKKLFDTLGIGEEAIGKDFDKLTSILKKNNRYQANPGIQLSNYIAPLEKGKSLIKEDKNALSLKFIEYKYISLLIRGINTLRLVLLGIITVGCYLSWWIIAFGIICKYVSYKLVSHYYTKHKNGEISADELMSKMNYIVLGHKLLCSYPLAAFSVYLLTTNFIANGLTVGGVILGSLLAWAIDFFQNC